MHWLLLLGLIAAQDTDGEKEIEKKVSSVRVTLDLQGGTLEDVVDHIRGITEINIVIDGRTGAAHLPVTMRVRDLSARSVLDLVLAPTDYAYTFREGALFITDRSDVYRDVVLRTYDIHDVLHPLRDFPGVDIALRGECLAGAFRPQPEVRENEVFPVVDLIETHTGGDSWTDNPDARVDLHGGILLVRNTKEVHRQIERLLGLLRAHK